MDFFTPDSRMGSAYKGTPSTLSELWESAREGSARIENYNSAWTGLLDETDARNKAIKDAGGPELPNPLRDQPTYEERQVFLGKQEQNADASIVQYGRLVEYEQGLARLEEEHPHLAGVIQSMRPPSLVVSERMHEAEKARADVTERRGLVQFDFPGQALVSGPINIFRDPTGMAAIMGGGFQAQMSSPVDIAAMLAGNAVTGPSLSLLKNALRNAVANAGSQALLEPQVQANRAAVGLEAGWKQALDDVAGAAGFGAAADCAVRPPVRAIRVRR
jgi:hypothetical protein